MISPPPVVEKIKQWLAVRKPRHEKYLFPLTKETGGIDRETSKMMEFDLAAARKVSIDEAGEAEQERETRLASDYLTYENKAGLVADFRANRHTLNTNLARAGVSPKTTQTLARHCDIRMTMNVYTHTDLEEKTDALSKLPSFSSPPLVVENKAESEVEKPMESATEDIGARRCGSISAAQSGMTGQSLAIHDCQENASSFPYIESVRIKKF